MTRSDTHDKLKCKRCHKPECDDDEEAAKLAGQRAPMDAPSGSPCESEEDACSDNADSSDHHASGASAGGCSDQEDNDGASSVVVVDDSSDGSDEECGQHDSDSDASDDGAFDTSAQSAGSKGRPAHGGVSTSGDDDSSESQGSDVDDCEASNEDVDSDSDGDDNMSACSIDFRASVEAGTTRRQIGYARSGCGLACSD